MKTITTATNVYKFEELNGSSQQKALEANYDINVDHSWWDMTYDDLSQYGIKIKGFDLGRAQEIEIEIEDNLHHTAEKIIDVWGEGAEGLTEIKKFVSDRADLVIKYSDGESTDFVLEENEEKFDDECDELEEDFKKELSTICFKMLQSEYDHLTSTEAIKETFKSNDYHFTTEGVIKNS